MTLLEDVKQMQQQGMPDDQIIHNLREKGIQYKDIAEAMSQTKIKAAVEQSDAYPGQYSEELPSLPQGSAQEGMELSIMNPEPIIEESQQEGYYPPAPSPSSQYGQQQMQDYPAPAPGYADYDYSQYQQPTISADLISEIAEQVVTEKLSDMRKNIEKVIDLKTTIDSRIEYLDDRLKKIEKTIDILQSSVLKKVGDYVTNVQDIKTELIETQKTFSKLLPSVRKSQPEHHNTQQHHEHHHAPEHHAQHHPQEHQTHHQHPEHQSEHHKKHEHKK